MDIDPQAVNHCLSLELQQIFCFKLRHIEKHCVANSLCISFSLTHSGVFSRVSGLHRELATQCFSICRNLKQNICGLRNAGTLRMDIDPQDRCSVLNDAPKSDKSIVALRRDSG
jgi:hypothetical protein